MMKQGRDLIFIEKIFIVFILLSSCTTIVTDFGIIRYFLVLIYIVMVLCGKIKILNKNFQITVLAGALGIWFIQLLWYENIRNLSYFFKIYIIIFMMVTYANADSQKNILRLDYFMKILFYFSIASNVVYFLFIMGIKLPQFVSSLGLPCYFYLLQEFYDPLFGVMSYRNNGIFWEPGVNQVFMNLLLIYTLFDERKFCKASERRRAFFKFIYIVITIIITGSVMGYVLCVAIIILKGLSGIRNKKKALMSVIMLVAILVAMPIVISLFNSKQETLSYEYRLGDLKIGLVQFLQHPIIGKGIGDDSYQYAFAEIYGFARSNSNGLLRLILSTGILGIALYALSVYRFSVWATTFYLKKSQMAFLAWFVLSLMNEPIESCAIVSFLIGVGWHSVSFSDHKKIRYSRNGTSLLVNENL